ncbi:MULTISPECIES: nitroreductase [Sphingobium]|nr:MULTISPECIES: nitroreductase [Sphingobium]MBJ7375232.1 nitroreductase [Sphingobium sp.]
MTDIIDRSRADMRADIYDGIVAERRSVRAFLPTALPADLIARLFTVAGRAPSNCNAQPWITHVVSGETLERIRAVLLEQAKAGALDPDVPLTSTYVDQYKSRRIGSAVALFEATGVGRNDQQAREISFLRNFELFDAPHAAFFFMPRYFGLREAADVGMYAQTLMLALTAHGLGSCAQGAISHYASAIKRELGVSDDLICLFGLSFGYPDADHPSTAAITDRAPLSETVVLHD